MFKKFNKKKRMPFFGKCGCTGSRAEIEEINILNYAHNNLTHVPEEIILHERTLEELYLDANRISELPRWLFQCHGLRILSLNDNEFQTLSPAIASLVNLENLDISKNGIQEIPDNIKCCKRISIIEASVNPIGRLPEGFMMLINLRELYLNDTFLEYLPGSFGRLSKLRILEVRENRLKTLPKSLSRLTELERLDLGTNDFDIFPEVICNLVSLLELWMDNNKIEYLPKDIQNLKNLMFFDLSKNQLRCLPNEIGKCSSLSDLYLSENQIYELPDTIGQLSSLTILKLDSNLISRIPFSIGGLSSLSELILNNNKIEELPTSIGLLRNLRTLNLDENNLYDLPPDIGSCTGITLFSLRANNLEYLPEEIGRINKLRVLNLSSNRLKYLPCSICKLKELQALWLTENQTKPLIPLQQDKDKTGKRFLTCYLFPQDFLRNDKQQKDSYNSNKSILKTNYNDNSAEIEEQNYYDRQHLIRFIGENNNNNNNNNSNSHLLKPYPKEMKNPMHHLRNLAIYENSINHVFNHQNHHQQQQQQQENGSTLHAQFLKSLNFNQNSEETQLLLNNNEIDDINNLENNLNKTDTNNKNQFMNNNYIHRIEEDEENENDDNDLNELIQIANNNNNINNKEQHHRVSFSKTNEVQSSPQRNNVLINLDKNCYNKNQDFVDFYETKKPFNPVSMTTNDLNNSPRTAKLNHQKLISKIHYDKVQEILQNKYASTSSPATTIIQRQHQQFNHEQYFNNNINNENSSFQSPAILNDGLYFNNINNNNNNNQNINDQYDQPTPTLPTQSPGVRKSILKQTTINNNYNYDNTSNYMKYTNNGYTTSDSDNYMNYEPLNKKSINLAPSVTIQNSPKINHKSIQSPLLNTQIIANSNKQTLTNTKSPLITTINIPSSPLKVNVNDIKWTNLRNNNINNEPPSSQLSSDSGYSGQTAINMINNKLNSINSSPIANESNDTSYLPTYEYHQQIKQKNSYLNAQIVKNPGLGFSISGGKNSVGNPFKPNDPGIFVTKIQPDGPASNILQPGDQIIKVNGEDFTNIEHDKAVAILKSCNKIANLLIKRY